MYNLVVCVLVTVEIHLLHKCYPLFCNPAYTGNRHGHGQTIKLTHA